MCKVEDIDAVDRGVFAFKPSNSFLIRTRSPNTYVWAPGLWWRLARRVGIRGMTAAETKFMSEMLSVMLAERGWRFSIQTRHSTQLEGILKRKPFRVAFPNTLEKFRM